MLHQPPESWILLVILSISVSLISGELTIQEMIDKAESLRKQVEDLPLLQYEANCILEDEEAYNFIKIRTDQCKEEEIFYPPPANKPFDYLTDRVLKINQGEPQDQNAGILCAFQKGLTCKPKDNDPNAISQCICNKWNGINVTYDTEKGQCLIDVGAKCSSSFPGQCRFPSECYLDPSPLVPEELTRCSEVNRWVLNLKDDHSCSCCLKDSTSLEIMSQLQDLLVLLPYLDYGQDCQSDIHGFLFNSGGLVDSVLTKNSKFHGSEAYETLRQSYVKATDKDFPLRLRIHDKDRIFCDMKKAFFCNSDTETCGCFSPAIYNSTIEQCVLPKLSPCLGESNPYPCEAGSHCLFKDVNVLCTDASKNDIKLENLKLSDACYCSMNSYKPMFNQLLINDLKNRTKEAMSTEVYRLNNTLWNVVEYGAACSLNADRIYFEMQDFILAGKEDVYYAMKTFDNLIKESEATGFKKLDVCDLTKSMRCGFLSQKCECPVVIYFSEVIKSKLDTENNSCVLPQGSRCHSNLPDWLPCQDGEACIYETVPVLCNRKNKEVATQKRFRFPTAVCSCSSKPHKTEFEDEVIRKYSMPRDRDEL